MASLAAPPGAARAGATGAGAGDVTAPPVLPSLRAPADIFVDGPELGGVGTGCVTPASGPSGTRASDFVSIPVGAGGAASKDGFGAVAVPGSERGGSALGRA
jgi:hypothetical protein